MMLYAICNYRNAGGVEAERIERQKWVDAERKKISDSVNGKTNCPYKI
jgi:hypothetical protein